MAGKRSKNFSLIKKLNLYSWQLDCIFIVYREISKTDGFIIAAYFLDQRPKGDVIRKHN